MTAVLNCYCLQRSAPYWSNPPVLIFDIRALCMALSPERQSARMSQIKTGGLDQYDRVCLNGIGSEMVNTMSDAVFVTAE